MGLSTLEFMGLRLQEARARPFYPGGLVTKGGINQEQRAPSRFLPGSLGVKLWQPTGQTQITPKWKYAHLVEGYLLLRANWNPVDQERPGDLGT